MMELNIRDEVYQFKFGIGFLKDISKTATTPVPGMPGVTQEVGLNMAVARLIDGDVLTLVDVLEKANKRFKPRVTTQLLEEYVDDPETDIDALFKEVLDFLSKSNATKKTTTAIKEATEEAEK